MKTAITFKADLISANDEGVININLTNDELQNLLHSLWIAVGKEGFDEVMAEDGYTCYAP